MASYATQNRLAPKYISEPQGYICAAVNTTDAQDWVVPAEGKTVRLENAVLHNLSSSTASVQVIETDGTNSYVRQFSVPADNATEIMAALYGDDKEGRFEILSYPWKWQIQTPTAITEGITAKANGGEY